MVLGMVTVCLVDAILFLLIGLVHAHWRQQAQRVPIATAAALLCLCCAGHFAATKTLGFGVTDAAQARVAIAVSAVLGFAPIWAYVHMLLGRVREETEVRRAVSYPSAKRLRIAGDIEGALREYLRYYEQDPQTPTPLFSAAGMLEMEKDYKKAAVVFRQIMERFEKDDALWGKAALRLVRLRREHLNDVSGSERLRVEIENRLSPECLDRLKAAGSAAPGE